MIPKMDQMASTISFSANSRHTRGPKGKGKNVMTLTLGLLLEVGQSKEATCWEQAKTRRL
jgi:hypothetical protein